MFLILYILHWRTTALLNMYTSASLGGQKTSNENQIKDRSILPSISTNSKAIQSNSDTIDDLISEDDEVVDDEEKITTGPMMSDTIQHRQLPISAPSHVVGSQAALGLQTKEKMCSELPNVEESADHFVLYDASRGMQEKDLISFDMEFEEDLSVLMPYYTNSCKQPDANNVFRLRSELIEEAFQHPENITTVQKLKRAIVSYNYPLGISWDFSLLENFEKEDEKRILKYLLPKIVRLALNLPNLLTRPLPFLKRGKAQQLSLTQMQIASLLANAFLCTFPKRNTINETTKYLAPINFNSLFEMPTHWSRQYSQLQKLWCLIHYFHRNTEQEPTGVITFSRRYMLKKKCEEMFLEHRTDLLVPTNDHNKEQLHNKIETCGPNSLQIDFANKKIGGGVLGSGCVQEEIRFVICPELIVARLFVEELDDTEALVIVGAEQYSEYSGYADTFRWQGDYKDRTKKDSNQRRNCSILAIDAQNFQNKEIQFTPEAINRELFKALAGFYSPEGSPLSIATGNWGCGIFGGDPHLKAVLQMMAAAICGRRLIYHTMGDRTLTQDIKSFNAFAFRAKITVGETHELLMKYRLPTRRGQDTNVMKYLMKSLRQSPYLRR